MAATEPTTSAAPSPTRRRGRPRGGRLIVDREEVVAAAIRAVREFGPSVTMDDIAAAADVTKPIIYRMVGDKDAIAEAVAEDLSARIETTTSAILAASPPSRARFHAAVLAWFKIIHDDQNLFMFVEFGRSWKDGDQLERLIDLAAAPLIEGFAHTTNTSAAARTWGYATIGAIRSVAVMWLRNPYCSLDALVDDTTRFLAPSTLDTDDLGT